MTPHYGHSPTPSFRCMLFHDQQSCSADSGMAELAADPTDPRIFPPRHYPPLPVAAVDPVASAVSAILGRPPPPQTIPSLPGFLPSSVSQTKLSARLFPTLLSSKSWDALFVLSPAAKHSLADLSPLLSASLLSGESWDERSATILAVKQSLTDSLGRVIGVDTAGTYALWQPQHECTMDSINVE